MNEPIYEPVSLGNACETKYQLARVLDKCLYPGRSSMSFRLAMAAADHGEKVYGWRIFDWQTTPLDTICEYLERDFQGVFEREDFAVTDDGIYNVKFNTRHLHEFQAHPGARVAQQDIDAGYPMARRKFERLAADFRRLLTLPGPYLYVWADTAFPNLAALQRLIGLLSRRPEHRFHLLVMARDGHDGDLSSLGDLVTKASRPLEKDKPQRLWWEGPDAPWDAALEPFKLTLHELAPRSPRPEAPPPLAPASEPRGFLGGLFRR